MHWRAIAACLALLALAPAQAMAEGKKKGHKGHGKKRVQPHWEQEWYAEPQGGLVAWSSGGSVVSAATLGGQAGLRYWRVGDPPPQWSGQTRARVAYVLSSADASGLEARLGSFMGPRWKTVGIQAGPDLFWDQWQYGSTVLDPSLGLSLPVTTTLFLDAITLSAGATPSWLANEDRRVDWNETDVFGFGHEFTWTLGATLRLDSFSVGAQYAWHVQATGVQQGLSFGVAL